VTYAEAIKFLYGLSWFGARLGLETTRALAERAGNPQDQLRFIHVAGTNGKGSTCAMLESIYRAAGLRVGCSPRPTWSRSGSESRSIASSSARRMSRLVGELSTKRFSGKSDQRPSRLFEFVTVMALRYFAEQKCDLVIWETGLGGRLDATNIVTPLASVITNIGFDHQQWLGDTCRRLRRRKLASSNQACRWSRRNAESRR
jgi:dihydrofolate synthase/folylpolyglutamate synthase